MREAASKAMALCQTETQEDQDLARGDGLFLLVLEKGEVAGCRGFGEDIMFKLFIFIFEKGKWFWHVLAGFCKCFWCDLLLCQSSAYFGFAQRAFRYFEGQFEGLCDFLSRLLEGKVKQGGQGRFLVTGLESEVLVNSQGKP